METIAAYMAANPSMESFLANPVMEEKQKKDVLSKLGKEADFHPFTSNFLNLLVDKKRIGNIADIVEEFENLYCESTDTQVRARPFPAPVPPPRVASSSLPPRVRSATKN
jgi:F-type H+-transporting ATPase subunit delta